MLPGCFKTYALVMVACLAISQAEAQFADAFQLEIQYGWAPDPYPEVGRRNDIYSYGAAAGVSFGKRQWWYAGLELTRVNNVGSRLSDEPFRTDHWLYGAYATLRPTLGTRVVLQNKVSLLRGDYCPCGQDVGYVQDGLYYVRYRPGLLYSLSNRFEVGVGMQLTYLLNDVPQKFGFNSPMAMLSYTFGKPFALNGRPVL